MTSIGVLIPYVDREPWQGMRVAQASTWASELPSSVHLAYYRAANAETRTGFWTSEVRERLRFGRTGRFQRALDSRLNRRLRVSTPLATWSEGDIWVDTLGDVAHLGLATLAALESAYWEWNVDFFFRSNASSYVNGSALLSLLARQSDLEYGGWVESGSAFWGWDFVNGAGIILSRKAVGELLHNRKSFDHRFIDDVAIGRLFSNLGIQARHISRPFVGSMSALNALTSRDLRAHHIRLRTQAQVRTEANLLRTLHGRVVAERDRRP